MDKRKDLEGARRRAAKMRLGDAVVTVAICGDHDRARCASKAQMKESWKYLKRRAKEIRKEQGKRVVVMRTECLGVCRFGPVAAVFPSGAWYGGCTPEVLERMLAASLDGDPVAEAPVPAAPVPEDYLLAKPLPPPGS